MYSEKPEYHPQKIKEEELSLIVNLTNFKNPEGWKTREEIKETARQQEGILDSNYYDNFDIIIHRLKPKDMIDKTTIRPIKWRLKRTVENIWKVYNILADKNYELIVQKHILEPDLLGTFTDTDFYKKMPKEILDKWHESRRMGFREVSRMQTELSRVEYVYHSRGKEYHKRNLSKEDIEKLDKKMKENPHLPPESFASN